MKKIVFFALFSAFLSLGHAQSNEQHELLSYVLDKKYSRVPVKYFIGDSTMVFKLVAFNRYKAINPVTNKKEYPYSMTFMRMWDGKKFVVNNSSDDVLISALNNDLHYFYTDGDSLYLISKAVENKQMKKILKKKDYRKFKNRKKHVSFLGYD